jgi:hypothetical protein
MAMKLTMRFGLAVLASVGMGAPAVAQAPDAPSYQWTVRAVSVDLAVAWSIRTLGNGTKVVQVAARWATEQPASGSTKHHYGTMATWQPDCANSNVMRIADRFYDADGKQTQHVPGSPDLIPFSQTGPNEALFRALCGGPALSAARQTNATVEAAQQWLAGLL